MKRYIERPQEVSAEQWRGPGHDLEGVVAWPHATNAWGVKTGYSSALTPIRPGGYLVQDEDVRTVLSPNEFRKRYRIHPEEESTGHAGCCVIFKGQPCVFPGGHAQPCAGEDFWLSDPVLKRGETKRELWERWKELFHDGSISLRDFFWDEPGGSSAVYWPIDAEAPLLGDQALPGAVYGMDTTQFEQGCAAGLAACSFIQGDGNGAWSDPGAEAGETLAKAVQDPAIERDLEESLRLPENPRPAELAGVEEDSDPPEGRAC